MACEMGMEPSMMNDQLNKQIANWIIENLPLVSRQEAQTIHLDDLMGRDLDPSEVSPVAWQVFTCLLKQIEDLGMPAQPVVIIFLEEISNRIEKAVPASPEAIERQVALTPPGMYLVDWSVRRNPEYKASLPATFFGREIDGVHISYEEYLSPFSQPDEEYGRAIIIEYLPASAEPAKKT